MKGKHRGSRETRQDDNGLAVGHRQAYRFPGFERRAVHHDPGVAKTADNSISQIAGPLRGAAR